MWGRGQAVCPRCWAMRARCPSVRTGPLAPLPPPVHLPKVPPLPLVPSPLPSIPSRRVASLVSGLYVFRYGATVVGRFSVDSKTESNAGHGGCCRWFPHAGRDQTPDLRELPPQGTSTHDARLGDASSLLHRANRTTYLEHSTPETPFRLRSRARQEGRRLGCRHEKPRLFQSRPSRQAGGFSSRRGTP